jgi:hypothetical protein
VEDSSTVERLLERERDFSRKFGWDLDPETKGRLRGDLLG